MVLAGLEDRVAAEAGAAAARAVGQLVGLAQRELGAAVEAEVRALAGDRAGLDSARRASWLLTLSKIVWPPPRALLRLIDPSSPNAARHSNSDRSWSAARRATTRIAPRWVRSAPKSRSTPPASEVFELISDLARRPTFTDHFLTDFHLTRIDAARGRGRGALPGQGAAALALDGHDDRRAGGAVQDRRARRGGRSTGSRTHTVWELTEAAGRADRGHASPTGPSRRTRSTALWRCFRPVRFWQERGWREALQRLRDILEAERPGGERIAVAGGNRYATGIPLIDSAADVPEPPIRPAAARRPGPRRARDRRLRLRLLERRQGRGRG